MSDHVIVLIVDEDLRQAEKLIESCEGCNAEGAEISFDNVLDQVTVSDPSVTNYLLESPAKCQNWLRDVTLKIGDKVHGFGNVRYAGTNGVVVAIGGRRDR